MSDKLFCWRLEANCRIVTTTSESESVLVTGFELLKTVFPTDSSMAEILQAQCI